MKESDEYLGSNPGKISCWILLSEFPSNQVKKQKCRACNYLVINPAKCAINMACPQCKQIMNSQAVIVKSSEPLSPGSTITNKQCVLQPSCESSI